MHIDHDDRNKVSTGFSLVELSIVLVILGLLTGGVLAGQSLIRAAELRSVTQEFSQYTIAINAFKDRYFQIPGDMDNATRFWGDNATHCADPGITDGTPGTCNGNNDGVIERDAAASGQESEGYMFWQHLANAGLVDGNYSGLAGASNPYHDVIGVNVPASDLSGGGWNWDFEIPGNSENYNGNYTNILVGTAYYNILTFGASDSSNSDSDKPILPTEDAWQIDKKIDDGRPAYGNIIAKFWNTCTDAANNNDRDSDYLLSDTDTQCALFFINALN